MTLKLKGQVFSGDGRDLAARLNAVLAYWNTMLGRNKQPDAARKLQAITGPICCPPTRRLGDPWGRRRR